MKYAKHSLAAVALTSALIATPFTFADDFGMSMSNGDSSMSQGDSTMTNGNWQNNSTNSQDYWAKRKIEMQQKSTEMRKAKVAEMQQKGIDVSNITGDLLDGTKTEESEFWKAAKAALDAHEIVARKKVVEEMKSRGIDVSMFTEDVIADGQKFWDMVKKAQGNFKPAQDKPKQDNGSSQNQYAPRPNYGDGYKNDNGNHYGQQKQSNDQFQNQNGNGNMQQGPREPREKMEQQKRPALTKKARETLVKRLSAISEEKKAATYEKMKATVLKQMENAKAKRQKLVYAKLEETLQIMNEILAPKAAEEDDDAIIDSITSEQ